MGIALVEE